MRTKKTLKNLIVSIVLTTLVALIGLVKIKYFLKYLGDEVTGIYQLFYQILSYISLVDAGLTSSLLYTLYKPVSANDDTKINAILKGGRNFYNKIALIIIAIGVVLSFKIDFFISQLTVPLVYVQICFILFIIASALNYFVTSQKVILEARQNLYKVHLVVYISMIVKGLLEIFLLTLHLNLLSLMLLFIAVSIIQNIIITFIAKKDYPKLNYKDVTPNNDFKKETKNLIAQKISSIIFNNIDVILISKFISTGSVVIYTSYSYIINSLQNIVKKIGSSSLAGVGNLLATEKDKAQKIFYEYNAMCFYIAALVCIPLLIVITPFVSVYYGDSYTLPYLGGLCICLILYFKVIEIPLDVFNNALGYFKKIKNCVIFQSAINLALSIILLFKLGIPGVLLATVISYIVGEFAIYPYILNNNYFKDNKIKYYKTTSKYILLTIISYLILYIITKNIVISNLLIWFITGLICFIVNFLIITIGFKIFGELQFYERFRNLLLERKKAYEKK